MNSGLKRGDRVWVYGPGMLNGKACGNAASERLGQVVQPELLDSFVVVRLSDGEVAAFHPKQCRKLGKGGSTKRAVPEIRATKSSPFFTVQYQMKGAA